MDQSGVREETNKEKKKWSKKMNLDWKLYFRNSLLEGTIREDVPQFWKLIRVYIENCISHNPLVMVCASGRTEGDFFWFYKKNQIKIGTFTRK